MPYKQEEKTLSQYAVCRGGGAQRCVGKARLLFYTSHIVAGSMASEVGKGEHTLKNCHSASLSLSQVSLPGPATQTLPCLTAAHPFLTLRRVGSWQRTQLSPNAHTFYYLVLMPACKRGGSTIYC